MNQNTTRRVFFAATPGASEREAIEGQLQNLEFDQDVTHRLRWLDPAGWHVTLRFVGNVAADLVPHLLQRITPIEPFTVRFTAIEPFPSMRRPAVLAATGTAEEAGHTLAAFLDAECVALSLPPDSRQWRPHMSLARVRGRRALDLPPRPLEMEMQVDAFVLMESVQSARGNRYQRVDDQSGSVD